MGQTSPGGDQLCVPFEWSDMFLGLVLISPDGTRKKTRKDPIATQWFGPVTRSARCSSGFTAGIGYWRPKSHQTTAHCAQFAEPDYRKEDLVLIFHWVRRKGPDPQKLQRPIQRFASEKNATCQKGTNSVGFLKPEGTPPPSGAGEGGSAPQLVRSQPAAFFSSPKILCDVRPEGDSSPPHAAPFFAAGRGTSPSRGVC